MQNENKHQVEVDYSGYEDAYYMYETPETGLFQSTVIIEGLEFASIESLKKELNDQYGIMVFKDDDDYDEGDDHYYDEDKVWTGEQITELVGRGGLEDIVICKEGAYYWYDFDFEYKFAGNFNKQKTNRIKCLVIPEDMSMLIDGEITVIKSRSYEIVQEETQIINSDIRIEMFTIQLLSGKSVTIPNSPGVYKIYEADSIWVDHIK